MDPGSEWEALVDSYGRLQHQYTLLQNLLLEVGGPGMSADEFRDRYFNPDGTVKDPPPESTKQRLERLGNDLHYAALMRDEWLTDDCEAGQPCDPDTRLRLAIEAWENR